MKCERNKPQRDEAIVGAILSGTSDPVLAGSEGGDTHISMMYADMVVYMGLVTD